ncbi:thrombospondin-related adhesive protein, putative [Babesia ovis]|uniref:Thrombospondin-related adhesive protein, putative n=1 Tax=Babesia ovis TaxID=5869 RepID=A0A9W5TD86_BABOV|nr:thrombospondin-related adhesive protein, putative [Babesia ovis]
MVRLHTLPIAATLALLFTSVATVYGQNDYEDSAAFVDQQVDVARRYPRSYAGKGFNHASGLDFIVLVQNTSQQRKTTGGKSIRDYVKEVVKSISSSNGTNRLSLVGFSTGATKWLSRRHINKDNVRHVIARIDKLFERRIPSTEANLGSALKFVREHLYSNSSKYLLNDTTTELELEKAPGKDTVLFIITNGNVLEHDLALKEAFDARRNGAQLFVVNTGVTAENFWSQLLGCRHTYNCINYVAKYNGNAMVRIRNSIKRVCSQSGRDAVCFEDWSPYSECSKPCDAGVMTSKLQGYRTLVAQVKDREYVGRTCQEQLRDVKEKQLMCNMQSCDSIGATNNAGEKTHHSMGHGEAEAVPSEKHVSLVEEEHSAKADDEYEDDDDGVFYITSKDRELSKVKVASDWYTPGYVAPVNIQEPNRVPREELERMRKSYTVEGKKHQFIPRLYDGDKGLDRMLQYAADVNHYLKTCVTKGKDYVVALENTSGYSPESWEELRAYVKLLVHGLSSLNGTSTISLVNFSTDAKTMVDKAPLTWDSIRYVSSKIDEMFDNRCSDTQAKLGGALKFVRENVYPRGNEYLVNDKTTVLELEKAAGKDTVVFVITNGNIMDHNVALEEAFNARRNGVIFYVVDVDSKLQNFWAEFIGCRYHYSCPNYLPKYYWTVMNQIAPTMRRICAEPPKDAVCIETWTQYSSCSKPCGPGVQTAQLQNFETVLTHSKEIGSLGRSCVEQLHNVRTKQLFCNMGPCKPNSQLPLNKPAESQIGSPAREAEIRTPNSPKTEETLDTVREDGINETQKGDDDVAIKEVNEHLNVSDDSKDVVDEPEQEEALPKVENEVQNVETPDRVADTYDQTQQETREHDNEESESIVSHHNISPSDESVPMPETKVIQYITEPSPKQVQYLHADGNETNGTPYVQLKQSIRGDLKGKNIWLIVFCTVLLCAIIAGMYTIKTKQNVAAVESEEGIFLDGSSGGKDEEPESQQIIDANNQVWA